MRFWRDVDSQPRHLGVSIWARGAELLIGRRVYRMRWRG